MARKRSHREFERIMLPHLDSAFNLALWLLHHPSDAEDAAQEAYLKAFKSFDGWSGENAAGWLLKIIRNTCMTKLKTRSRHANVIHLDTEMNIPEGGLLASKLKDDRPLPDAQLITSAEHEAVRRAVRKLPSDFREVIVLREFEDLSYRQIAEVTGVPIVTVMSRLSRARTQLRNSLKPQEDGGRKNEM